MFIPSPVKKALKGRRKSWHKETQMSDHKSEETNMKELRRRAETCSRMSTPQKSRALSKHDKLALIHDLQVHQVELEMQNEELRRAQKIIEESIEKYSDLYDFAPVGYVSVNRKGLILEANLTFTGQLGIERSRLINSPLLLYLSGPDGGRLISHLELVFKTRERQCCELRLKSKTGEQRFVQMNSIWVKTMDGAELCRMSVTDISERKKAEEALIRIQDDLENRVAERTAELSNSEKMFRKLSREFQSLLNAISDTLILLSPSRDILWTNDEKVLMVNTTDSDPVERYCCALMNDRPESLEDSPVARCFDTGEKEVSVLTYRGAVLDIRAFPIKEDKAVVSVLLFVSDITEKMTLQAEAIHAVHMASLGELAAGVAHEINNPITGIINYGQILVNDSPAESMEKDIGQRIVKEGERISRIVKTLLTYAHDRRNAKRPVRIPAILEESIILFQAQIRKEGIALIIDFPEDLPEIVANFQKIQQCFINIVNNARYALNEKYPERHEDKRLTITGGNVMISGRPHVRIIFTDTGVGIPAPELPMLTKPFFSTKPFGKGTGLGLDITHKIITEHGGCIGFESTEGEFTRVIIDLPACERQKEV